MANTKVTSDNLDTNIDIAGTFDVTGATTLDSTLAVAGATTLAGQLNVVGDSSTDTSIARFKGGTAQGDRVVDISTDSNGNVEIQAIRASDNATGYQLTLNPSGGNIGIGESSPAALLNLKGATATNEACHILFENTQGAKKFAVGAGTSGVTNNNFVVRNVTDSTFPLVITDAGNVGIGTTSPSVPLHINSTNAASNRLAIFESDINNTNEYSTISVGHNELSANFGLMLQTSDTAYVGVGSSGNTFDPTTGTGLYVNANGKVGIGTTSPNEPLTIRSSAENINCTLLEIGNDLHATNTKDAWIKFVCGAAQNDNSWAIGAYPGSFRFSYLGTRGTAVTTASAETMRILSDGNVLVGKTAANSATVGFEARADGRMFATAAGSYSAMFNRTSSHGALLIFAKDDTQVGSISTNANSLPSDKNFKKDIEDLNIGLDLVTKLKPVSYNYKIDEDDCPKMFGLIAQDLETSLTEVGVTKNSSWLLQHEPTKDEKESDYSLDYTKLTPILIKSIQEQQEQIEQLKSEIEALKS